MSDIDDCRKSVERLTRDRGEVMRAGSDKIAEIRARHEVDNRYRDGWHPGAHNDRATLLAEVERLRAEIERLHKEADLTREALGGWALVPPDGGANPTHERVAAVVAEVELLTRQRDEARAALMPFSELYLWPDDAGQLIAERVRAREDWDEAANDEKSNAFCILRGEIRAARKALEGKP